MLTADLSSSSTSITVRSPWRTCAEASLYGLRIGTTWATPGAPSRPRRATCSRSPIAPITVTSCRAMGGPGPDRLDALDDGLDLKLVALAFITIIIRCFS